MPPKRKIKSSEFIDDSDDPEGTRVSGLCHIRAGTQASAQPLAEKRGLFFLLGGPSWTLITDIFCNFSSFTVKTKEG